FSMGLTYFGHPVACAAALKNIEIMERESLLPNSATVGEFFQSDAQRLCNLPYVGDVRGKGLMLAVDLVADKASKAPLPVNARAGERVFKKCVDNGVIVRPIGDRIVLSPPIIISTDQCSEIVDAIGDAIQSTRFD
ncbi:MAG: aminotransferase class III-fold pyridoxal phosphate-dependent enzyme, partial [Boseongicola sp.]|nr:aminotransferase class III-fold pyridoxal phosphate-dependent enzyme [Boseongicola sp.]